MGKKQVFRHYKTNTDCWIIQTTNNAAELKRHLKEPDERVKIMPFYDLPRELCLQKEEAHGDDYVYVSNFTRAKGHEDNVFLLSSSSVYSARLYVEIAKRIIF